MPRPRPPFPAVKGLWDSPTVVNNVETLANIPYILREGLDKYTCYGTEKSKGTKVFCLGGKVNNVGLVEIPMGLTLRELIYDIGGGIQHDKKFKAKPLRLEMRVAQEVEPFVRTELHRPDRHVAPDVEQLDAAEPGLRNGLEVAGYALFRDIAVHDMVPRVGLRRRRRRLESLLKSQIGFRRANRRCIHRGNRRNARQKDICVFHVYII